MTKFRLLSLSLTGISLAYACGKDTEITRVTAALPPAPESSTQHLEGKAYNEKPCSIEISKNPDGSLKNLKFTEEFKVDYKIPAPGSGLYGIYYWQKTFDTAVNFADSTLKVKRAILGDADVLEGDGKPLFWDVGPTSHKLIFKPSLKNPKKVTYQSTTRIAAVIPFVVIDGECNL